MNYRKADDLWRLYRREWVIVHTITRTGDSDGHAVFDAVREWMQINLGDRVKKTDMRISMNTDNAGTFWAHAEVFKDNLKGEFKHPQAAQAHAMTNGYDEYTIVPRNSKSDHDLRSYGVVKL